jgi:hypothetical protein
MKIGLRNVMRTNIDMRKRAIESLMAVFPSIRCIRFVLPAMFPFSAIVLPPILRTSV